MLPHLQRKLIDVKAQVQFQRRKYRGRFRQDKVIFRLVGVYDEQSKCYHLYLTNIPADRLEARQIAELYRLRWQVEILFKELKTYYRLDQLPSSKRAVVEALIYAALLTLLLSQRLLQELRKRVPQGRFIPSLRWATVFCGLAPHLLGVVIPSSARASAAQSIWDLLGAQAIDPHVGRPTAPARLEASRRARLRLANSSIQPPTAPARLKAAIG